MNEDIGQILENWPFDPENSIRKVNDSSGVEKIQVRVDQGAFQGVLQMNLDGRPDGRRPHNSDFAFDHYRESQQNVLETEGSLDEFQLRRTCPRTFLSVSNSAKTSPLGLPLSKQSGMIAG